MALPELGSTLLYPLMSSCRQGPRGWVGGGPRKPQVWVVCLPPGACLPPWLLEALSLFSCPKVEEEHNVLNFPQPSLSVNTVIMDSFPKALCVQSHLPLPFPVWTLP